MTLLDVLKWIIENWQVIVAAAAACILAYSQIKKFMKLSDEQKKEKALELIRGAALSLMANAEAIFKGDRRNQEIRMLSSNLCRIPMDCGTCIL